MKVSGLLINVDSNPGSVKIVEIEELDIERFHEILNCNIFDIVTRKIGSRVFNIVCDDEGLFKDDPQVSAIAKDGKYMLVGNLFVCNNYKEHLTSLSKDDLSYIMNYIQIASFVKSGYRNIRTHPMLTEVEYA